MNGRTIHLQVGVKRQLHVVVSFSKNDLKLARNLAAFVLLWKS